MAKKFQKRGSSSGKKVSRPAKKIVRKPIKPSRPSKPVRKATPTRKPASATRKPVKKISKPVKRQVTKRPVSKPVYRSKPKYGKSSVSQKKIVKKSSRTSYKQKYNDNLAKILEKLTKDVRSLKKQAAGKEPKGKKPKEFFPKEDEDFLFEGMPKNQSEALEMIMQIRAEMNERNVMLDELRSESGKLYE